MGDAETRRPVQAAASSLGRMPKGLGEVLAKTCVIIASLDPPDSTSTTPPKCPPARRTEHPGHQPPVRDSQVQCIELEYSFCRGVRMSATSTPETSLVTVRLAGRDDLRSTTAQPAIACPPGNPSRPTYHQPHLARIAVPPCRRAPTLLAAQSASACRDKSLCFLAR